MHEPRYAALARRVLAIPDKRYTRRPVAYLERDEIDALLRAPDPRTRTGSMTMSCNPARFWLYRQVSAAMAT